MQNRPYGRSYVSLEETMLLELLVPESSPEPE